MYCASEGLVARLRVGGYLCDPVGLLLFSKFLFLNLYFFILDFFLFWIFILDFLFWIFYFM
jgi:hypothetical protein